MYLCRHATGTIEDYVKEAINLNFDAIGFTDHAPWEMLIDRSVRMQMDDYPIYLKELDDAINKYGHKIKIYKAVEIEYFNNKTSHYEHLLKTLDYMTLGQHYIEKEGRLISTYKIYSLEDLTIYKDTLIKAMDTGYFKFLSHPDLFLFSQKHLSDDILKLCEDIIVHAKTKNIPLEINANGIRKGKVLVGKEWVYRYPRKEFWQLVKHHQATCLISSDAHKPEFLYDDAIDEAYAFARALGLEVVEALSFA